LRYSLRFGFGGIWRFLDSFVYLLTWQVQDNAFCGGWTEGLGNGLFPPASTSSASTTAPASASTLAFASSCRLARLLMRVGRFFARGLRFELRLGGGGNFGLIVARFDVARLEMVRLRLGRCAWSLLRIEICWLQWGGRRLTSLLRDFLLTAL
jgi:hypothetical protein